MTTSADILADGFERVREAAGFAGRGLAADILEARIDPEANTIAWLLWHIARVQDAQVSDLMGAQQVWTADGWSGRFNLELPERSTGYGHKAQDVAKVRGVGIELYLGYLDAVCDRSVNYVGELRDSDFDDIVDERFTPPVTRAVRLFSVISDDLQHAGQAAILRGILERRG